MERNQAFMRRLEYEYKAIMRVPENEMISVMPAHGEVIPYVRKYLVEYRVPTWIMGENGKIRIQNRTVVRFELSPSELSVRITAVEGKTPFHPNWYESGRYGGIHADRPSRLVDMIEEVCRSLQFDPCMINTASCSNQRAGDFYCANKDQSNMFPTDCRAFPGTEPAEIKSRISESGKAIK